MWLHFIEYRNCCGNHWNESMNGQNEKSRFNAISTKVPWKFIICTSTLWEQRNFTLENNGKTAIHMLSAKSTCVHMWCDQTNNENRTRRWNGKLAIHNFVTYVKYFSFVFLLFFHFLLFLLLFYCCANRMSPIHRDRTTIQIAMHRIFK